MMRPLRRSTQLAVLITISMAAVASPISAQEPPTAPKPYPRTVTIVYDVRDLLLAPEPVVPDVELGLRVTRRLAEAAAAAPAPDRDEREQRLIADLQERVDPASWESWGAIQSLNGNLIVTTTASNHDLIERIFTDRRAKRAVQVLVEAQMIVADRALVERLRLGLERHDDAVQGRWGSALLAPDDATNVRAALADAHAAAAAVAAPRIITLDGRPALIVIDSRRVVGLPRLDGTGPVEVRPLDGAALWLEPTVSTDRRTVTLAVNPRLAELLVAGVVVEETEAQVAATLSIPDGHSMLLVLPLVRNRLVAVRTGPGAGGAADGDERVREIVRERVPDPALDEGVAFVLLRADVVVIGADERE